MKKITKSAKAKHEEEEIEEEETAAPAAKAPDECDVEGCRNKKAPGQTYVCTAHIRT